MDASEVVEIVIKELEQIFEPQHVFVCRPFERENETYIQFMLSSVNAPFTVNIIAFTEKSVENLVEVISAGLHQSLIAHHGMRRSMNIFEQFNVDDDMDMYEEAMDELEDILPENMDVDLDADIDEQYVIVLTTDSGKEFRIRFDKQVKQWRFEMDSQFGVSSTNITTLTQLEAILDVAANESEEEDAFEEQITERLLLHSIASLGVLHDHTISWGAKATVWLSLASVAQNLSQEAYEEVAVSSSKEGLEDFYIYQQETANKYEKILKNEYAPMKPCTFEHDEPASTYMDFGMNLIHNNEISWTAKGIGLFDMIHIENLPLSVFVEYTTDSKEKVESAIEELRQNGYEITLKE